MTKMVGIAEFKAKCERLLNQMEKDGEPIALTRRGKPIAIISAPVTEEPKKPKAVFGFLKNDRYRFDCDPEEPAADPSDWEALR